MSVYTVECGSSLFCSPTFYSMSILQFIHSPTEGHFRDFSFITVIHRPAMNVLHMYPNISFSLYIYIYLSMSDRSCSMWDPSLQISDSSCHMWAWAMLLHSMWDYSSWNRDWTLIPCTARQTLNPGVTREVPRVFLDCIPNTEIAMS